MREKEMRRAPRRNHNSVVEIYDNEGNHIADVARLVDFSKVGACFASPKYFPLQTILRLRLRLLREGRLYIKGRVVRATKRANTTLYGFEFEKVYEVA